MTTRWVPGPSCREQRGHRRHDRLTSTCPPGPETEFRASNTKGSPSYFLSFFLLESFLEEGDFLAQRGCLDQGP